jgi:hypothetical protein
VQAVEFYHDLTDDVLAQTRRMIDDAALRDQMTEQNYQVGLDYFSYEILRETLDRALHTFDHD